MSVYRLFMTVFAGEHFHFDGIELLLWRQLEEHSVTGRICANLEKVGKSFIRCLVDLLLFNHDLEQIMLAGINFNHSAKTW